MQVCVTLVHGTWARDTAWTKRDSSLCRKLEEVFGWSLILRSFRWSGSNSFSGRSAAASNLRKYLQQGIEENPLSKQVVIGHSHGGNVILYALRDRMIRERIDGVVCLSTPFIVAIPRDFGARSHVQAASVKTACSLYMLSMATVISDICMKLPYFQPSKRIAYLGVELLIFGIVFLLIVFSGISIATIAGSFVVVRSTADEASSALTAVQFAGWLATMCWKALSTTFGWLDLVATRVIDWSRGRTTFLYGSCVVFCLAAVMLIHEFVLKSVPTLGILLLDLLIAALMGVIVMVWLTMLSEALSWILVGIPNVLVGLLFLPLYLILSILTLPFSPLLAFALWSLQITVEATPPGACRVVQISPPESRELRHSSPYSDSKAIQEIVNWTFASANRVEARTRRAEDC